MDELERSVFAAIAILGSWARLDAVAATAATNTDTAAACIERLESRGAVRCVAPGTFKTAIRSSSATRAGSHAALALMHGRAAAVLLERGAPDAEICDQLLRAPGAASEANVQALWRHARARLAHNDFPKAIACLRRALLEPPPADLRGGLQLDLARALLVADEVSEALDHARSVMSRAPTPGLRAEAATVAAQAMARGGKGAQGAATLLREIERVQSGDPELASDLRNALLWIGAGDSAHLSTWLRGHRDSCDPEAAALTGSRPLLRITQAALADDLSAEAAVHLTRGALGQRPIALASREGQLSAVWLLIRADARHDAEEAITQIRAADPVPPPAGIEALVGLVLLRFGSTSAAVTQLREALHSALARPGEVADISMARAFLAHALFEARCTDELSALLAQSHLKGLNPNAWTALLQVARGRVHLESGQAQAALDDFQSVASQKQALGLLNPAGFHQDDHAVRALRALARPPEEALTLAHENLTRARAWGAPITLALAIATLAICQAPAHARQQFEQALALVSPLAPNLHHAQIAMDLADALLATNHRTEATALLKTAFDEATQLGAARIAGAAHAKIRMLGLRPRRSAIRGVAALTPAELRVAETVAAGHSNRATSQLLYLSVRTVENHLRRIYRKLDCNRAGLAGCLIQTANQGTPDAALPTD